MERMIECLYCSQIDPIVAVALKRCPRCDRKFGSTDDQAFRPPQDALVAHSVELEYATAPLRAIEIEEPLVHEAHDVLDYASALLDVVRAFLDFSKDRTDETCLLGFMTGSGDLTWLARRVLGVQLESKVRLTRGLSHKAAGQDPVAELRAILTAWRANGLRRLVVVDELVGGAQLGTALRELCAWARAENLDPPLELLLVAVAEPDTESVEQRLAQRVLGTRKNKDALQTKHLRLQHRCIETPLLAKDKPGQPLKDYARGDGDEYAPWREWKRRIHIQCSADLRPRLLSNPDQEIKQTAPAGVRVSSTLLEINPTGAAASVFGALIWDAAGFEPSLGRAQRIERDGCSGCAGRVRLVREKGASIRRLVELRSKSVVLRASEHDGHGES